MKYFRQSSYMLAEQHHSTGGWSRSRQLRLESSENKWPPTLSLTTWYCEEEEDIKIDNHSHPFFTHNHTTGTDARGVGKLSEVVPKFAKSIPNFWVLNVSDCFKLQCWF